MRITRLRSRPIQVPLIKPFKTALRTLTTMDVVLLSLETDEGIRGFGAASPTAVITGDTLGSIHAALELIGDKLTGKSLENLAALTTVVQTALAGNPSPKAAVEMALYDLYGQMRGIGVGELLGGSVGSLRTDLTISLNDPEEMAEDTRRAKKGGFTTLKIKVGGSPEEDLTRLLAVREAAGPAMKIRVDANQGWKPKEAVVLLKRIRDAGVNLELVEQPVAASDLEGMRFVREHCSLPVVADESCFSPRDALAIVKSGAADGLNIKLMKCGGFSQALKIAAIAEAAGLFCMAGSMMEGHTGVTAAAHFAAACGVVSAVDLDVPLLCAEQPESGGAVYRGEEILLPEGPGLGMAIPSSLLEGKV